MIIHQGLTLMGQYVSEFADFIKDWIDYSAIKD